MPSLRRDLRSQLEKTVLKARELAEQGAREALATLGIDQAKPFDHLNADQRKLRNQLRARGRQAGDELADSGRQAIDHLTGITAYEHWHRMLFARFLAENSLLLEPEHQVPVSLADVEELAREDKLDVWELAGRFAQRMLPAVFRADDPVLALPLARETRVQLERLVADLPREVFLADDSLGWTYQFWQAKRKEEVNESGVKIGADEISPVTQLFTEDYMVEFLLDNTLGAWWAGKLGPIAAASEEDARAEVALPLRDGLVADWKYLRFVRDESSSKWSPAAGTFTGWPRNAQQIRFIDPCMGSGHFLVFALPLLARLRVEEEGLSASDAVAAVLHDNIYGLELDERCTQIAAFNLALAAWKIGGYQDLPPLHLACSGLAPNASEREWVLLAGTDLAAQNGMARIHRLFTSAPVLGSLINPRTVQDDLLDAAFTELQPLLQKALAHEAKDDTTHEMAVTARGLAKAAEILAGQFTLVATNVPYLGRPKQSEQLMEFCELQYQVGRHDLATTFLIRLIGFCSSDGCACFVSPQNWFYQPRYTDFREHILRSATISTLVRLGPGAFESITGEVVNTCLGILTNAPCHEETIFSALDVRAVKTAVEKAATLPRAAVRRLYQARIFTNPKMRIVIGEISDEALLGELAKAWQGIAPTDAGRFRRKFWEIEDLSGGWVPFQSSCDATGLFTGREHILFWEDGHGAMKGICQPQGTFRGKEAWTKRGVSISKMGSLSATLFTGEHFDSNAHALVPTDQSIVPALWAFCSSPVFAATVREIEQRLDINNSTVSDMPIDLVHWQKVAVEKYPDGLPKPFSNDPTQWLFNGHPQGADQPLQVAVARLLGYQWPRQTGLSFPDCPALSQDGLEQFADEDGIVCLTPMRGERSGADRLRALLAAALEAHDEHGLIAATDSKAKSMETWLRDEFFAQHCALFHHPFILHIWDGRSDGFHALVNYHKLAEANGAGRKLLETLTYSYLGDWIRAQQDGLKRNEAGSEDRLIAAQALQRELEAILRGEPPYDLFIRWKPLQHQPIGWEPDINDGVRMNIRPFLLANDVGRKGAGILRAKPNIKWDKDRGTEPERPKQDFPWFWSWDETSEDFPGGNEFDGCRWNSCHYSLEAKRAARAKTK